LACNPASSTHNIPSVEALYATSLRDQLKHKNDSQLWDLNEGVILPKHLWSQLPFSKWPLDLDWFVENLVVSGAYRLESWERQQQIVLRRNDLYFDPGLPMIERLVFRIVPQKLNQIGQLLSGELDFVNNIPISEAASKDRTDSVELRTYWAGQYNFICWNVTHPLFAEAETRQALTMAIDRKALIDSLWFGRAKLSTSPILSSTWAHNRALEPWPYDPKESLASLSAQGWSDSDGDDILDKNGEPFSFELLTNSSSSIRVDATVMIQEQLRRIGIEVKVRSLGFGSLNALVSDHDFDAFLLGWIADTSLDQTSIFHTDSIDGASNFGGYSNPELDRLIDLTNTDLDFEDRTNVLHEIQAIIHHDQPYTFLWESKRLAGISKRVQGATPNALDALYKIETWWLLPDS
jgi:peptide/nickel transport system substrate-binding protein